MNDVLKTYETVNGSVRLQYEEGVLYVTVLEGDIVHVSQKAGIQSYAIEDADHIKILQPEVRPGEEPCRVRIAAGNIEVQVKDNEKLDIFYRGKLLVSDYEEERKKPEKNPYEDLTLAQLEGHAVEEGTDRKDAVTILKKLGKEDAI